MEKIYINKRGIQWRDLFQSYFVAVGTPLLTLFQEWASSTQGFVFDWNLVGKIALSASVSFIIQRAMSKPKVVTVYQTNKEAEQVANEIKNS